MLSVRRITRSLIVPTAALFLTAPAAQNMMLAKVDNTDKKENILSNSQTTTNIWNYGNSSGKNKTDSNNPLAPVTMSSFGLFFGARLRKKFNHAILMGDYDKMMVIINNSNFDSKVRTSDNNKFSYMGLIEDSYKICTSKKKALIKELMRKNLSNPEYDINQCDALGRTDAHIVINYGDYELIKQVICDDKLDLLKRSKANSDDNYIGIILNSKALQTDQKIELLTVLLDKILKNPKYNPNKCNKNDYTDAALLIKEGYDYIELAKKALSHSDVDMCMRQGRNNKDSYINIAAHALSEKRDEDAVNEFVNNIIKKSMNDCEYTTNMLNWYGWTDVMNLIAKGFVSHANMMMKDRCFNPGMRTNDGNYGYIWFILERKNKLLTTADKDGLIESYMTSGSLMNYNINSTDEHGRTDMHYLAKYGYMKEFNNRLKQYPDFDLLRCDNDGKNCINYYDEYLKAQNLRNQISTN